MYNRSDPRIKWRPRLLDSRARRLAAAVVAGMGGRLAMLIAPLLATPIMLHYFGDADFGIWATSVSITSLAVFADLGIGNGLLTRIAGAFGKDSTDEINRYTASAYFTLGTLAVALIALTTIGYFFYLWFGHSSNASSAAIVFSVLVIFFAGLPASIFHNLMYGLQKVPTSNFFLTIGSALGLVGCLLAVHFAVAPWVVATAYSLPPVIVSFVGTAWFFYRNPKYRPRATSVQGHYVRDLLTLSSHFFILSILTAIGLNIDNLIISINAGPEAVTAYSIPARLGSVLGLLILTLFMPLWGANGEALAKGEFLWVKRSTQRMSLFGCLLVIACGAIMILLANKIIMLWVGRAFADQNIILMSVVATSTVVAFTSPYSMVLNALGRAKLQIWPWLAFVLLSVPLKYAFVGPQTLWLAAAITGLVYAAVVTPTIVNAARRQLRSKP